MLGDPIHYSRLFPELRRFSTDEQRQQAWDKAVHSALGSGSYYLMIVLLFGLPMLGLLIAFVWRRFPDPFRMLVAMALATTIGVVIPSLLFHRRVTRVLHEQLLARQPICRGCGYSLQGLVEPRCPECGQPFGEEKS